MAKKTKKSGQTGQQTRQGFVSTKVEAPDIPDYVVVELRYESPVAYTASSLSRPQPPRPQADALNKVLAKYDISTMRSHFGLKAPEVRQGARRSRGHAAAGTGAEEVREEGDGHRRSSRAASCRSCPRRAATRRRSRDELNRKKGRSGRRTSRRGRCRRPCRRLAGREPQLRASAGLPARRAERHRRDGGLDAGRREGQGHHDLRHRGQLEPAARGPALGHPVDRRHGDQRSRLAESRHGGARRDDLDPRRQRHRRHQP